MLFVRLSFLFRLSVDFESSTWTAKQSLQLFELLMHVVHILAGTLTNLLELQDGLTINIQLRRRQLLEASYTVSGFLDEVLAFECAVTGEA